MASTEGKFQLVLRSVPRMAFAVLCALLLAAWLGTGTAEPNGTFVAPANDNFANAETIAPSSTVSTAVAAYTDNNGATTEVGEPPACASIGATVWYNWAAPNNSPVNIDTFGSIYTSGGSMDTVLAIYTGNAIDALTPIVSTPAGGCNDDYLAPSRPSLLRFTPVSGTTYRIRVGGFNGGLGNIVLNFSRGATMLIGITAANDAADGKLSLKEALMVTNGSFPCGSLDAGEQFASPGCSGSGSNLIHFLPVIFPQEAPATIPLTVALPTIQDNDIISGVGAGVIIDGQVGLTTCLSMAGDNSRVHD